LNLRPSAGFLRNGSGYLFGQSCLGRDWAWERIMDFSNEPKKVNQKYVRLRPVPSIRVGEKRIVSKIFIDRF
jgi:hypothetical protein